MTFKMNREQKEKIDAKYTEGARPTLQELIDLAKEARCVLANSGANESS